MNPDIVLQWDWLNDQLRHTLNGLYYTPMGAFVRNVPWTHPTFELLQVLGTSLLIGAICVLDLRLIGFPRNVPPRALHGMIQVAEAGAVLTLISGIFLVCRSPDLYLFNAEARWKVIFVVVAALNILLFHTAVFEPVDVMNEHRPSLLRRVLAAVALAACLGAISAGRLAGSPSS
jgi:hypothetical protein